MYVCTLKMLYTTPEKNTIDGRKDYYIVTAQDLVLMDGKGEEKKTWITSCVGVCVARV